MTPEVLIRLVTGSAGALVVLAIGLWMLATGKLHSDAEFRKLEQRCAKLEDALEAERRIADSGARGSEVTVRLLDALTGVVAQQHPSVSPAPGGDRA